MEKLAILAGLLVLAALLMVNGLWWLALVCGLCTITLLPPNMFRLVIFVMSPAGIGFALFFHEWEGAAIVAAVAIYLLPIVRNDLGSLLEHTRFEGMVSSTTWPPSRAKELVLLMLLFAPAVIWGLVDEGWMAVIVPLLGFAGFVAWLAFVMRREGWSREKAREKEPVDGLR